MFHKKYLVAVIYGVEKTLLAYKFLRAMVV